MARRRSKTDSSDFPGLFDIFGDDSTVPSGNSENCDLSGGRDTASEHSGLSELSDDIVAPRERLRYISFGSGSSGNCSYIGTRTCGVLVDAGVDNNYVMEQLAANSIDPATIGGILLTHDHGDHVRYAYALLRRNRHMRLYATPRTLNGILRRHNMSRRVADYHSAVYKEFPFSVGPLTVTPFETSHDGTDNVGFCIEGAGSCIVVTTDTGCITDRADFYIRRAAYLMLESNYDADMLRRGSYPEYLKARIVSDRGHLDNAVAAEYLAEIHSPRLRHVFLCHLSKDNNTPEVALSTIGAALSAREIAYVAGDNLVGSDKVLAITVLPRSKSSALFVLE